MLLFHQKRYKIVYNCTHTARSARLKNVNLLDQLVYKSLMGAESWPNSDKWQLWIRHFA